MLRTDSIITGALEENCYIVYETDDSADRKDHQCVIIDPGDDPFSIISRMNDSLLSPQAILITHAHFDHIGAVEGLINSYPQVPIYAHEDERACFEETFSMRLFKNRTFPLEKITFLKDQATLDLVAHSWRLIHTPGHTQGGACYYIESEKLLFSGDTLFRESVGRTDFFSGDLEALKESIQGKLMLLKDDTEVLPGHGPETTIGHERRYNFIMHM